MTRRTAWISGFLSVTALAVVAELYAAFDTSPDTVPWTDLLVRYVPWPVLVLATAALVIWLPAHLWIYYRRARAGPAKVPGGTDNGANP